jgi:hypothetical protein
VPDDTLGLLSQGGGCLGKGVTIGDFEEEDFSLCFYPDSLGYVGDVDGVDWPVTDDVLAGRHLEPAIAELDGRGKRTAVAGQAQ